MGQSRPQQPVLSIQAAWFLLVGAAAAGVHFVGLLFWVQVVHVAPAWANVWAFLLAFWVSFSGHYWLTFRQQMQTASWLASLWRWFLSSTSGFALNQLLFVGGLWLFGHSYYVWIWLLVTLLVTILTFVLGKFWAFGGEKQHE
ncbi:GtrA family protein [Snodgrassella sp. CFCC 13594]|uniref:GtrA family protein n=1 Tax=Snodgrassella sp. CFCC 13594 TaxID=1775559 RepID=UPI000836D33A|nr:GtrA family protein [Snodgrassella sp. CFCC 13594]